MFFHSSHLLPFLFSIPRFLPSLTRSTSRSARLPLISSELALQQPRCAIRGHLRADIMDFLDDNDIISPYERIHEAADRIIALAHHLHRWLLA